MGHKTDQIDQVTNTCKKGHMRDKKYETSQINHHKLNKSHNGQMGHKHKQ